MPSKAKKTSGAPTTKLKPSEATVSDAMKEKPQPNGGKRFVVEGGEVLDRQTKRRWGLFQVIDPKATKLTCTTLEEFAEAMNRMNEVRER